MQLVVLGMHRSGTSALTRVLNLLGCYVGGEDAFNAADEANPKGYWERRDVHQVNEDLLAAAGANWFDVGGLELEALDAETRAGFSDRMRAIVLGLESNRPWVIKDPRMCLTFPLWRQVLERPICLIAVRNPLEVARSLQTRDGMPLAVGVGMWEIYQSAALRNTEGMPRLLVSFQRLLSEPMAVIRRLAQDLAGLGVSGLSEPSRTAVESFIDPALHRARSGDGEEAEWLDARQMALWRALRDGSALESDAGEDWREPSISTRDLVIGYGRLRSERKALALRAHQLSVEVERLKETPIGDGALRDRQVQLAAALEERREAFFECERSARSLERALGASEREREILADRLAEERSQREASEADRARIENELAALHLQHAALNRGLELTDDRLAGAESRLAREKEEGAAWRADLERLHRRTESLQSAAHALITSRSLRLAEMLAGIGRGLRGRASASAVARLEIALAELEVWDQQRVTAPAESVEAPIDNAIGPVEEE